MVIACLHARLQELSLFYDSKFDCAPAPLSQYQSKLSFESPHSFAFEKVPPNARVLDLGCAAGYMAVALKEQKNCYVAGVDAFSISEQKLDAFYHRDLNQGLEGIPVEANDYVLLLDVIEHLAAPEAFLDDLRNRLSKAELIISTGNIAFIVPRIMLALGNFNYGKRGILDLTHTRLFTFKSLSRLLEQSGFIISEKKAIPAPIPLALGDNVVSRMLLKVNSLFNRISPGLFGYQMIFRATARPNVKSLLEAARETSAERVRQFENESTAQ